MAGNVTLTAALRSNLFSLQNTQSQLDITQGRLATGRKVNSALDDPNSFFAAQALNNRAGDLNRLLDGIGQGIQVIQAADNGITALTNLIEQAQSIAETARDQASGAAVITTSNIIASEQADITTLAGVANNDQFSLQAGTGNPTVTFTVSTGDSLADIANQINSTSGFSANIVAAGGAGGATDRRLEIRTTNGEDLISAEVTGTPLAGLGALADSAGTFAGTQGAVGQPPADRVELEGDFNQVLTQINELIQDTGYRGTNLLNGDSLSVQFNEDNSSSLTVAGVTFDAAGLGVANATFDTDANIQTSLNEITGALNSLRSQARSIGGNLATLQNREEFTQNLTNTLLTGADKLTLADQNEEAAKLLSLQTSQQLGVTALSLASQAQQSVLRLF